MCLRGLFKSRTNARAEIHTRYTLPRETPDSAKILHWEPKRDETARHAQTRQTGEPTDGVSFHHQLAVSSCHDQFTAREGEKKRKKESILHHRDVRCLKRREARLSCLKKGLKSSPDVGFSLLLRKLLPCSGLFTEWTCDPSSHATAHHHSRTPACRFHPNQDAEYNTYRTCPRLTAMADPWQQGRN